MINIEVDKRSLKELQNILDKKARAIQGARPKVALAALKPMEDIAKQRVRVDTGDLRDSIRRVVEDDSAILFTDKEYATSSEYLDQPFMRPAAKNGAKESIREATRILKQLAENK